MSIKWHTGVSANLFLCEHDIIPQCPAQQEIRVLICQVATDCPHKCYVAPRHQMTPMKMYFIYLIVRMPYSAPTNRLAKKKEKEDL